MAPAGLLGKVGSALLKGFHLTETFKHFRQILGAILCAHNIGRENKQWEAIRNVKRDSNIPLNLPGMQVRFGAKQVFSWL